MPIFMLTETRQALGPDAARCESRSLFQDRFADPQVEKDERKNWFTHLIGKRAENVAHTAWLPATAEQLHARLMGRLMVNMARGVMENAGLLLDRYGLPVIPGSAVKACARRMALQALHDWFAAGTERPSPEDACAPCCVAFTKPEEMLAAIARVFGWVVDDWKSGKKDGHFKSDFAWAAAGNDNFLAIARELLPRADTFAGSIAFLPAHPNADPGIEPDVVTPHHTAYYEGRLTVATDTEDPIPVFFPAVKAQKEADHFTFPLLPLRNASTASLTHAKTWLAHGLELFGLGAKTAAGYGWFHVAELEAARIEISAAAQAETSAAALQAEAENNAALLSIAADDSLLARFAALMPDALRGLINKFQFDEKFWPQPPAPEAGDTFRVSLLVYLTETNRTLYDTERANPKSKVLLALQKLAARYARPLPE